MDTTIVPFERIEGRIFLIRGKKVMLDRDLAELYGVETKVLNQAVKRNLERFPEDFMFNLSEVELKNWKSQFVTSNRERMGLRKLPLVFTEQGVAMLSSVLKSERAVMVNIQIIRTFTKLREMISENDHLRRKLEVLEKQYDEQFKMVFDALRRLLETDDSPKPEIGFRED
ncbi:ORF6N domain-containing protein [Candidatus Uhrbacteria bacterium]|nr:MAG: ORF6N domain-containing protein [Candidatus Uhrbacteria bacterium]